MKSPADMLRAYGVYIVIVLALPAALYFVLASAPEESRQAWSILKPAVVVDDTGSIVAEEVNEALPLPPMPAVVKGIYITSSTAASTKRFQELVAFAEASDINTLVIDVKDGNGRLAFAPTDDALKPYMRAQPEIPDLVAFTAPLKEKGFYLVARLFVFQDPTFAGGRPDLALKWADGSLWRDNKGVPFLDPASHEVWEYAVATAREVVAGGFDEVQFDYIRFPSDGKISQARYPFWDGVTPKHEVMRQFFAYLHEELRVRDGIRTSADLFGYTMIHHDYDLNIGQLLRDALPYFDAVSPMIYPSHYTKGYLGYANPAAYPYEVVKHNFEKGNELVAAMRAEDPERELATFRPWLQDFDIGADYDVPKIQGQIRATMEGGGSGWMFWNARNVYNEPAYLTQ